MNIKQIKVGLMDNFTYIISSSDLFIVIDPSWGFKEIKEYYLSTSRKLEGVLITHGHFDHINDLEKLIKEFNPPVYISREDLEFIKVKDGNLNFISNGDTLVFGDIIVKVIHTPGHSPGSVCYLIEDNLFTGDTLFIGCCGRVDLPGSNPLSLRDSLLKILKLDENIKIFPGHSYNGNMSTLKKEKENNPFLKASSTDEFLSMIL